MAANPEFGLGAVGHVISGVDGHLLPLARVIRRIVNETVFADALGVDVFHIGSTTAATPPGSAPDVVLAAIAELINRIRLGSSVRRSVRRIPLMFPALR